MDRFSRTCKKFFGFLLWTAIFLVTCMCAYACYIYLFNKPRFINLFIIIIVPILIILAPIKIWGAIREMFSMWKFERDILEKQKRANEKRQEQLEGCPICNSDNVRHSWKYREYSYRTNCSNGCGGYDTSGFEINSVFLCNNCNNQEIFPFLLCPKCYFIVDAHEKRETIDAAGDIDHMDGCYNSYSSFDGVYCSHCGWGTKSSSMNCELTEKKSGLDIER